MGPSKDDLSSMLKEESVQPDPPSVRQTSGGSSGPPPNAFWGREASPEEAAAATENAVRMAGIDDEPPRSATRIRQEALRMLEVADDRNSAYSVHKTTTGGYQATAEGVPTRKRVPAALSGLTRFRDDPTAVEYGDDAVVDVVGMEQRFGAEKNKEKEAKSWSSRYSIDRTLLNLSGGSHKSSVSQQADALDKENERSRISARNLFGKKRENVFGSGFSFRSKKVFGQQGVNLKTEWMDAGERDATLGPAAPAKSWQEELERKKRLRRWAIIGAAVFLVVVVLATSISAAHRSKSKTLPAVQHETMSFYMTSSAPMGSDRVYSDVADLTDGSFLVHLGNLQDPDQTSCFQGAYEAAAEGLMASSIPTLVLPGSSDWNYCPRPWNALNYWMDNFLFFDTNWYYDKFTVERQIDYEANFAIDHSGVLVVGVFEVEGPILDFDEAEDRHNANFQWLTSRVEYFSDARAIVVMGNARPLREISFFDRMLDYMDDLGKPYLYIHSNLDQGGTLELYNPYDDSKALVLEAPAGYEQAPVRLTVGLDEEPFILDS